MKKLKLSALWVLLVLLLLGCSQAAPQGTAPVPTSEVQTDDAPQVLTWDALKPDHSAEILYAQQFAVDYCEGGYVKISIDSDEFLVVPEGGEIPEGVPSGVTVLQQPLDHIYLVSSSTMDLFRGLDAIGNIRLSALDASDWYIPEAVEAMENEEILYAGKYSAPDYELILWEECDLAIENTMIYHSPKVKEQLEEFGIPVLVDRSSYESNPLGRMEWIKLYGALLGKEEQANAFYSELMERINPILSQENTGKTVAFFYITSTGTVSVRKPGDYISKCIGIAGGDYVFKDLGGDENALSTMNIQMEAFYAGAKDADVLIYNSTINGELHTMDELVSMSELLSQFKAVREGNVWCTGKSLYQESLGLGNLIVDMNTVFTQDDPNPAELTYLYRLAGS